MRLAFEIPEVLNTCWLLEKEFASLTDAALHIDWQASGPIELTPLMYLASTRKSDGIGNIRPPRKNTKQGHWLGLKRLGKGQNLTSDRANFWTFSGLRALKSSITAGHPICGPSQYWSWSKDTIKVSAHLEMKSNSLVWAFALQCERPAYHRLSFCYVLFIYWALPPKLACYSRFSGLRRKTLLVPKPAFTHSQGIWGCFVTKGASSYQVTPPS